MNSKGQLSIDLLLSIALVLLILIVFASMNSSLSESYAEQSIILQEKEIAELIQEQVFLAHYNSSLKPVSGPTIEFMVPSMVNPKTSKKEGCSIVTAGNELTISFNFEGNNIIFTKNDFEDKGFSVANLGCGKMVTIT